GIKARRIKDRVFGSEKAADLRLEFLMLILGTAYETDGCHAVPPTVHCLPGSSNHTWIIGQSEVVIRAKHQHVFTVTKANLRALRRSQRPLGLPKTCTSNFTQLRLDKFLIPAAHLSKLLPVKDHFTAVAGSHHTEAFLEIFVTEAVRDHRLDIE